MTSQEEFFKNAEAITKVEAMLKDEDFSDYTMEAFDFEKSEVAKLWENFKTSYSQLNQAELKEDKKLMAMVNAIYTQAHKQNIRCINILARAKRRLPKDVSEPCTSNTEVFHKSRSLPVQVCDIETFEGDYAAWPTFRDLFTTIYINNDRLGPVEKLCYLFQKTSGDAREVNRNITVTADNFEVAWENLKATYENKRVLFNTQMKLLYNLAHCKEESASEIKRLQREINNCISTLRLYKIDVDAWDPLFVFHCSIRLPEQTLNLWEQSVKNKTEIPNWKEFNDFLTDRFRALESFANIRASISQNNVSLNIQSQSKHRQFKSHHTKVNISQCKLCKGSHEISACAKFLAMDNRNRAHTLRRFKCCFNCLKVGHMFADCPNSNGCSKCKGKHHNVLHREFIKKSTKKVQMGSEAQSNGQIFPAPSAPLYEGASTSAAVPSVVQNHHHSVSKKVLLATAWVNLESYGSSYKVRALIDPCSDESFITEKICKLLKLPTEPVSAEVAGLGGEVVSRSSKMASFTVVSLVNADLNVKVSALVVPQVTGNVPTVSYNTSENLDLPDLVYADPAFFKSSVVDILLGGDVYPAILKNGVRHGVLNSLVAQETIFGWIVTGPTKDVGPSVRWSYLTKTTIDEQIAKFWELEEVGQKRFVSEDDKVCEEIFRSTTVRNAEGRYVVNLPFKYAFSSLGPNRHIALSQFLRQEKSMKLKPQNKILYDEVLSEYCTLAHMEKINDPIAGPSYYLPHHGVFKPESTTTKLRVVFNASSVTSSGKSLNDILHIGPVLQKDLVLLILRWRFFKYVFNADITKMYRQILINPEHAKFQRIVYRSSPEEEIEDFELKTVTFGVNCAPYLALRTLLKLSDDEERNYPVGARILRESMYVDDALVGAHNLPDVLEARKQLVSILNSAGFELRKWTANMKEILIGLPEQHLLNEDFLRFDEKSNAKTLGVRWNAKADYFYFTADKISFKSSYTKREVLSIIARLFDPAGWLAPIIITAKVLMQQMWLEKTGWDEVITEVTLKKWREFVARYNGIVEIEIPRWVQYTPQSHVEFHGFSDSSEWAYAAALYVRVQTGDTIVSNLLVSKTKVAPIKRPSIPRLELCGAVLLSKLVESVMAQFALKNYNLYLWSDSTIVLAWLKKPPCNWKTFVANRVATILEKVGNKNWRHVVSEDNPADLATRGLTPAELKDCKLWWNGPEWLSLGKYAWPTSVSDFETLEETKTVQVHVARSEVQEDILDRFSSLPRATHVIAYMFRFYNASRLRSDKKCQPRSLRLSAEELRFVRNRLFGLSQQIYFAKDYNVLLEKKQLSAHSPLLSLTPFIDQLGVIRANGRLSNAAHLSYNERYPVILAYSSRLSRLYVNFIHQMTLHGGLRLVHSVIRHECWILRAKSLIKTCIHNCRECVLKRKEKQGQIMAALPPERTTLSRPFTNTGIDFAGPFEIKSFTGRYCKITKGYVCLFVCFATKAIHLEAVSDLSSSAFLAALARFIARRGCPSCIYSDNGRNFVGAAKEINANFEKHIKDLRDTVVEKYGHQRLEWHFIPAAAPHMGGLWEAGVKSFKAHFKKIAGQLKFSFEEFATLLATIEACLNSRPLSPLAEDIEDFSALTPGHFLIGSALLTPAEPEELGSATSILNRWRKVKALHQEVCRRWKEEYLKELQHRTKWKFPQQNLKENDLVALRNEPLCSTEWRLGRVVKLHPGRDKRVRVVDLKTQNGMITRPIHKLVLLPCQAH